MSTSKSASASQVTRIALGVGAALLVCGTLAYATLRGRSAEEASLASSAGKPLPELPQPASRWVHGEALTPSGTRGQVIFVDGWHPA